ncbi:hypothetical protein PanWU01x14_300110 [Parasponia andersonii]|uniref:Uncharacterized protein n=1 Tax=Parasponia andersonii TaxID=3476 RepID=A0A2P5AUA6_PARAD|nr:hypothetical protein PanWU01x14_300110 [Parasponia andersonii]
MAPKTVAKVTPELQPESWSESWKTAPESQSEHEKRAKAMKMESRTATEAEPEIPSGHGRMATAMKELKPENRSEHWTKAPAPETSMTDRVPELLPEKEKGRWVWTQSAERPPEGELRGAERSPGKECCVLGAVRPKRRR